MFNKALKSSTLRIGGLLIVSCIVGWFFFTFRILEVPPGINGDEAAIGYNAALVSKTGHDQNGRFFPLFVSVFDLTDWKQPITFYSTVLAFKLFGPSFALLREISVIFVLISAILIFFLTKEIFDLKGGYLSLLIFATIPAVLIQSHLALENIAPVPFVAAWLWMLSKYQKNLDSGYLIWAAVFLGISLFTYPGMRLIFPVFSILTMAFIYYLNCRKGIKKILEQNLKFLLIVSIFPIFMYAVKSQYPGAILAYNRPHNLQSYQEAILPYISSYDPSFLFIQGDSTPYHSTGRQGVFLLATLPLFALGIIRIIQSRNPMLWLILLVFFFTPLLYGLASSFHRGSRLLVLLVPFSIITSVGLLSIFNIKNYFWKKMLMVIIFLLIFLNYLDFIKDYWYEYPKRVRSEFAKPYHLAFDRASKLSKEKNLTPFIQSDFRMQNLIAVDFFEQAYFPKKLKIWKGDLPLPRSSIIIVSDYILSKNQDKNLEKFDDKGFGLIINQ